MKIRSTLLATASSIAMLGAAAAADLPRKAPPPAVAVANWAGWYVGISGGAARHDWSFTQESGPILTYDGQLWEGSRTGAIVGGHIGINWQSDSFVYGIEADGNWLSVKRSLVLPDGPSNLSSFAASSKIDWLVTVRGRAGLAVGNSLIYLTGGAAIAQPKNGWQGDKGEFLVIRSNKARVGWVAGGGFERMITPNWTLRGEVLHVDLGRPTQSAVSDSGTTYSAAFSHKLLIGRLGASLKW